METKGAVSLGHIPDIPNPEYLLLKQINKNSVLLLWPIGYFSLRATDTKEIFLVPCIIFTKYREYGQKMCPKNVYTWQ